MNCQSCLKVNPLPSCLGAYSSIYLTGLTFTATGEAVLKVTDTATRQIWYVPFTIGDDIDLSTVFPLMQHYYKLEFSQNGVTIPFTLTNPDSTTVEGCCMEFIPSDGLDWDLDQFPLSTTNCTMV